MEFDDPGADAPKKRGTPVVACDYCRRLHEKCSGTQPCDRCTRRGKQCTYSTPAERAAKMRKASPAVSSQASSTEISELKALKSLKMALDYRAKSMKLVESTLRTPGLPDAAKLAKYQSSVLSNLVMMAPELPLPDARTLPLALGNPENLVHLDDMVQCILHLLILSFGSMPHSDHEFTLKMVSTAIAIMNRIVTEFRDRVLTDMSTRMLPLRTFLSHIQSITGDVVGGKAALDSATADWAARDPCYGSERQNNFLSHLYSMKWSFYGDMDALHLARTHARDSEQPAISFFEIGMRHAMRRLHTDHRDTINASKLLFGDMIHYEKALEDLVATGRLHSNDTLKLNIFAAKAILNFDNGFHAEALQLVREGVSHGRQFTPESDLAFHIPASLCIMLKIAVYSNQTDISSVIRTELSKWRPSFAGIIEWENLIDSCHMIKQEQPVQIQPPIFLRKSTSGSDSSSSTPSPSNAQESDSPSNTSSSAQPTTLPLFYRSLTASAEMMIDPPQLPDGVHAPTQPELQLNQLQQLMGSSGFFSLTGTGWSPSEDDSANLLPDSESGDPNFDAVLGFPVELDTFFDQ